MSKSHEELLKFRQNAHALEDAMSSAIEKAAAEIDFDLRCLDWISLTPDFHIANKNIHAA